MNPLYAKDKNYVFSEWKIIKDIKDTEKFQILWHKNYARDEKYMYILLTRLEWVKYETFKILNEYFFRDKNKIFYISGKFKDIHTPKEFETISWHYVKYKWRIFSSDNEIKWADTKSFEVLYEYYSKDKNNVYFWGKILEKADTKSFEPLGKYNARDKDNVYLIVTVWKNIITKKYYRLTVLYILRMQIVLINSVVSLQ